MFTSITWNVGSLIVLSTLQECNILSASEYILGEAEEEHIQSVLSDFLESKYELLSNVVTNCHYNSSGNTRLVLYLEECIQRLLFDFQTNENSISKNYVKEMRSLLPTEAFEYFRHLHLNILLEMDKSNAKTAFGNIDDWKTLFKDGSMFYKNLEELTKDGKEVIRKFLLNSLDPDFKFWKFFIIILAIAAKNCEQEVSTIIKKHLKDSFKLFILKGSKNLFFSIFIVARTVCSDNENSQLESYTQWYKNTIGGIKYGGVTKEEFIKVMEMLKDMLKLEKSSKYLQVHANISINAPALCNEIVLKYKTDCRNKIKSFATPNAGIFDPNESIVIDD